MHMRPRDLAEVNTSLAKTSLAGSCLEHAQLSRLCSQQTPCQGICLTGCARRLLLGPQHALQGSAEPLPALSFTPWLYFCLQQALLILELCHCAITLVLGTFCRSQMMLPFCISTPSAMLPATFGERKGSSCRTALQKSLYTCAQHWAKAHTLTARAKEFHL